MSKITQKINSEIELNESVVEKELRIIESHLTKDLSGIDLVNTKYTLKNYKSSKANSLTRKVERLISLKY